MQIVKRIITLLIISSCIGSRYTQINNCDLHKFQCRNGECIINELLCDGTAHCKDASDETKTECTNILCPVYAFRCNYGACINGDSVCNGIQDCVDNSDETQPQCMTTDNRTTQPTQTRHSIVIRDTSNNVTSCRVPPQPDNGYWKSFGLKCYYFEPECVLPEETELELGSYIGYYCNAGYELRGPNEVHCSPKGWSAIPVCIEIRCKALTAPSTFATYKYNDKWLSRESPFLPGTNATLVCLNRYQSISNEPEVNVTCNDNGQWEPELRCPDFQQECGTFPAEDISNITELPWHAFLYRQDKTELKYYCQATIIRENLLITTAHCVYDENEANKQLIDVKQIYIITGNSYKISFSLNDSFFATRKKQVKNIYTTNEGNLINDIAILELVAPFAFSSQLVPVCIHKFRDHTLHKVHGKIPVLSRTTSIHTAYRVIQTATVQHIPTHQCIYENQTEQYFSIPFQVFQVLKFCISYTNDSSVCEFFVADRGSGFVEEINGVWYLRGVVSTYSNETFIQQRTHCKSNLYFICTNIASHIEWIEDVITRLQQNQSYPSGKDNSESFLLPMTTQSTVSLPNQPTPTSHLVTSSVEICRTPPKPLYGSWMLSPSHLLVCSNSENCAVSEGKEVALGSYITYECDGGYKLQGSNEVYCSRKGWSTIPKCIKIHCRTLSTASTEARCRYDGDEVSCEAPVLPRTTALLTCRNSYQHKPSELPRHRVTCNYNGQWKPKPIQCHPVCGTLPAEVTPNVTEFPWHASLYRYRQGETELKYYCGATIIRENLLITSAHCVYDESETDTQLIDAKQIYIVTGNSYKISFPLNDSFFAIRKNQVKNIYTEYEEYFVNDLAILELVEPFAFSSQLVPVCIYKFRDNMLYKVHGKIPVLSKTTSIHTAYSVLQTATVQHAPLLYCIPANDSYKYMHFNPFGVFQFCIDYTNDSSVREYIIGDRGSGFVVENNGNWYLRGVVSTYSNEELGYTGYASNLYSICTNIAIHIEWIEEVLTRLEQNQSSGKDNSKSLLLPMTTQSTVSLPIQPIQTSFPVTSTIRICRAPPQPQNGHWKLPPNHSWQCSSEQDCDVPEGTQLEIGSYLIYSCNAGYEMNGSTYVSCNNEGKWLNIPVCAEIRCRALNTVSTEARCTYNDDEWVSCEFPVLPKTKASLTCRNSYQREPNLLTRTQVRCNANGQWKPEPIRCVPVCGKLPADLTPLIINGVTPNITEFPWHASMYYDEPGEPKKYFCGASIIQDNLLITAAHCVYDESTKRVTDKTIYIVTGNIFRNYDSPWHDARLVRKNQVKHIYIRCDYQGLVGNYVSDIAILQLVEPFVLSTWLVPVCIDPLSDLTVLEAGAYGKVAGFGITASGELSGVLQALTVPYVTYNQCKSASQNANTEEYITIDKFCAGYSNGSSVCDGDSGGGLVFKRNNLWYLRGIVSVSLGIRIIGATARCNNNFYSLYTRISNHMEWIQDVMAKLKQNQAYPSCQERVSY